MEERIEKICLGYEPLNCETGEGICSFNDDNAVNLNAGCKKPEKCKVYQNLLAQIEK